MISQLHKEGKLCNNCGESKAAEEFVVRKTGRVGHLVAHCKTCNSAKQKERKKRDPTIYDRIERPSKLKRQYGLSVEDYDALLSGQNGKCAICHSEDTGKRTTNFQVDHCHKTGAVRGLLCPKCNMAIGLFSDSPELLQRAVRYLNKGETP